MLNVLILVAVIGVGLGLWNEITQQRRVSRMAKTFRSGGKKA